MSQLAALGGGHCVVGPLDVGGRCPRTKAPALERTASEAPPPANSDSGMEWRHWLSSWGRCAGTVEDNCFTLGGVSRGALEFPVGYRWSRPIPTIESTTQFIPHDEHVS